MGRQEPTVYVNGNPICARPPNKIVDINKKESEVEVKELKSLSPVVESMKEKFPGESLSATLPLPWRLTTTSSASSLLELPSIPQSLSMTRLVSPEPPLDASLHPSSRSSRSLPPSKVLLKLFLESMPAFSRLTDMLWTCPRMPCSEENLRLSKNLLQR